MNRDLRQYRATVMQSTALTPAPFHHPPNHAATPSKIHGQLSFPSMHHEHALWCDSRWFLLVRGTPAVCECIQ